MYNNYQGSTLRNPLIKKRGTPVQLVSLTSVPTHGEGSNTSALAKIPKPENYYYNGKLFIAYAGLYTVDPTTWALIFDLATNEISGLYKVHNPVNHNFHNRGSIMVAPDGHVLYAQESLNGQPSNIVVSRSTNTEDVIGWAQTGIAGTFSYPTFFKNAIGTLWLTLMDSLHKISISKSTDNGVSWSTPLIIADTQQSNIWAYFHRMNGSDTDGMTVIVNLKYIPNEVYISTHFLWSDDGLTWGNAEYYSSGKASGWSKNVSVDGFITLAELQTYARVSGDVTNTVAANNLVSSCIAPSGKLFIWTQDGPGGTPFYNSMHLRSWDGSKWQAQSIPGMPVGFSKAQHPKACDMQVDSDETLRFYLIGNDSGSNHPEIWKTTNAGKSITLITRFLDDTAYDFDHIFGVTNYRDVPSGMKTIPIASSEQAGGTYTNLALGRKFTINLRKKSNYSIKSTGGLRAYMGSVPNEIFDFTDFTVECIIRPTGVNSYSGWLLSNYNHPTSVPYTFLQIGYDGNRLPWLKSRGTTTTTVTSIKGSLPVVLNEWQQLSFVRKALDTIEIYLNGVLIGSGADQSDIASLSTGVLALYDDYYNYGDTQAFIGNAAYFRLWKKSRTQDEIKNTLFKRLTGFEDGLLLYQDYSRPNAGHIWGNGSINYPFDNAGLTFDNTQLPPVD